MRHRVESSFGFLLAAGALIGLLWAVALAWTANAQVATPKPPVQSDTTLNIAPSSPTVNAGDAFDLLLQISTDQMSWGMQAGLKYDPKLVEIVKVEEGNFYKDWAAANGAQSLMVPGKIVPDNEKGQMPVVGITILGKEAGGKGPSGNGTWLIVHAKAREGAQGTATFELDNVKVLDADPVRPIPMAGVKTAAGQIGIGAASAPVATPTAAAVAPPTPGLGAGKAVGTPAPVNTVQAMTSSNLAPAAGPAAIPSGADPSALPWDIIAPVAGVVIVGAVVVIGLRRH